MGVEGGSKNLCDRITLEDKKPNVNRASQRPVFKAACDHPVGDT